MSNTKKKVLLVGETWLSSATHFKGFDQFGSVTFHSGAEPLIKALQGSAFDLTHMPAHEAVEKLPFDLDGLNAYDAILLSDIGSSSLLLHPDVWLHGKTVPNRLKLLKEWTAQGGGLAMIGGYFSFQGIDGRARWRRTPIEDVLPVECLPHDDRIEVPEGFSAVIDAGSNHPILEGLDGKWPLLLGANEVRLKPEAGIEVLASLPEDQGGHPLLVTGTFGKGRTLAWMSDVSPHWLPASFSDWPGYTALWRNALGWLTRV
ncbi:glutamine amidotransferase [Mesorhizobium retamae]|uniref:Glutamine amidotransferase n=1 Tax=Mesorhizobium retamae TaxID=2912854 RepID=A0ABS9Q9W0_9HYPH|nr:glutamine amidotransferase [Mesorhizobium sp. IRAMC:0171]MCG7504175.1 glutamine amidotransferase [Mesorhizobium sp. IRAMC:0171]